MTVREQGRRIHGSGTDSEIVELHRTIQQLKEALTELEKRDPAAARQLSTRIAEREQLLSSLVSQR